MAGQRQPIELIMAKGRKNLTKKEIKIRSEIEVKPCTENIIAPKYLTASQKKEFKKISSQLIKINIMGETDCDALARYIVAMDLYKQALIDIGECQKAKPEVNTSDSDYIEKLLKWNANMETLDKRQDRYFKQSHTAAAALGLTIAHRCRLVIPQVPDAPKENKYSKFEKKRDA